MDDGTESIGEMMNRGMFLDPGLLDDGEQHLTDIAEEEIDDTTRESEAKHRQSQHPEDPKR